MLQERPISGRKAYFSDPGRILNNNWISSSETLSLLPRWVILFLVPFVCFHLMLREKVAREFWFPSLTPLYALWSRHLSEWGHVAQACVERSGAAETTWWACSLNQLLFFFYPVLISGFTSVILVIHRKEEIFVFLECLEKCTWKPLAVVCIFICFIITMYWKKYNVCAITSNNLKNNNTRCASIDSRKLGNVGFWLNGYVAFLSLSERHTQSISWKC